MEDIAVYCSWADTQLNSDASIFQRLPTELRSIILQSTDSQYLECLAHAARLTQHADILFPLYKPLYPELVARWIESTSHDHKEIILTISSLARILPFVGCLRQYVQILLQSEPMRAHATAAKGGFLELSDEELNLFLLALFRLLSFDRDILAQSSSPLFLSSLLQHSSSPIRYLAIQCLCMVMHFSDAFSDQMVESYVGDGPIWGRWEGRNIDHRLLKLWEEKRWKDVSTEVVDIEKRFATASALSSTQRFNPDSISPRTADVGGILLPRSGLLDSSVSKFVLTATAKRNLHRLGSCLSDRRPVLLCGSAGSSKTALVHEAARLLNQHSSMVTLHINEQTDAKSLLGLYTSSSDGKSFTWKAGVLTKAIQQGRWVLIEDIDRAPAEVMGVLRPILEDGELFLPNRKERIQPKDGFRIIATLKTSGRSPANVASRHSWLLSPRLWSLIEIEDYETSEVESLLRSRFPSAEAFIPTILQAHTQVVALYRHEPRLKALQTRSPSLRDLLKWSRRTVKRLGNYGQGPVSAALPETIKLQIFNDAVDCYAGYLNDGDLHDLVASCIAQEMGISPQQMRHCLDEAFVTISETNSTIRVGRSTLHKVAHRRRQTNKGPFALTRHAQRTLGRISAGVTCSEPCMLVGETGVGKTTLVQYVAGLVGQTLTVVNLSQQSEASDLLGGLKPVTTRSLILPLVEQFNILFEDTFSARKNEKFQLAIQRAVTRQNWQRLMILWNEAIQLAAGSLNVSLEPSNGEGAVHVNKRRKLTTPKYDALRTRWSDFSESLNRLRPQIDHGNKNQTFAFVEGRLVQAVRDGEWLLLDEINLASPDTLDHIVSLLQNGDDEKPTLLLAEAGNIESIVAHPNFRIFAAMNPATDTGKKDLPPGLRSRFTEVYVPSGDSDVEDLTKIIQTYLGSQLENDKRAALDLAKAYIDLKQLNQENKLTDGAGDVPHFSIRSLVRCLMYVSQHGASHGLRRAMFEGFSMSFFTVLSRASESLALLLLEKHLLSNIKNKKSFLSQQLKMAFDQEQYIIFKHHLVKKGPMSPDLQPHYIRTASVERNLVNLARAASMRRFPILLQGPTSAGKTSMVEYLAKLSGNKFVRINNHEHTDLQEYLGSYVSDAEGKLVYREGVLVDALRRGHWIVLDELNLAPSDVLEALNRLLDDNRELLIPESQEIVHPHPNFMLFATQNPAGLYGGRKRLSRAFRNRFLELHFDDIPEDELEIILRERAQIAPSFCTQIVAVYKKLSLQRQSARLFEQRNSFATLRDLFRWAARPVDDRQQLANHGFMLLAERVRDPAERTVVKKSIEETMRVVIDEESMYGLSAIPNSVQNFGSVVWTSAMRRLFVLVSEALKSNEPVLLVGETGCGKTQICQVIGEAFGRPLRIYNAHTNTETGDLIGSQRPIRNRSELANQIRENWRDLAVPTPDGLSTDGEVEQLIAQFTSLDKSAFDPETVERTRASIAAYQSLFTWSDGSLVRAMKSGDHFLLDEISLADDSVLERLNSVLEPSRTILLAEKGSVDNLVIAHPSFQFLATMNPGGDYGKRELSAALRNRLTEIWVPPLSHEEDILPIVRSKLSLTRRYLAGAMLDFAIWFRSTFHNSASMAIPLRGLLAWADFINRVPFLDDEPAFLQGAFMVYVDSIGANPAGMTSSGVVDLDESRRKCLNYLQNLVKADVYENYEEAPILKIASEGLRVGRYLLPRSLGEPEHAPDLVFDAPTTLQNTMRIVRALQMSRPILLEGSPGVGKTAIVTALARASGKELTRINLSDQTDLMDLFGADTPSESEELGNFSWQNGPLLKAMESGGWVLLDEMNLASQSVLEGLNSCLDHRREVYIAELDKSFTCHPDFTLFAAQNPHHQGGGRKGLPASFVNRFTVVYADSFREEDLLRICEHKYPSIAADRLSTVIKTITNVERVVSRAPAFSQGGPWELNLRDVDRWLRLCEQQPTLTPSCHFRTIVAERFRTAAQRELVLDIADHDPLESFYCSLEPSFIQIGTAFLARDGVLQHTSAPGFAIPVAHLPAANSVITAINQKWPVVLAGPSGCGKTSLIRSIAAASGVELVAFSMNADVDTMDLVGGFEQYDVRRDVVAYLSEVKEAVQKRLAVAMRDQSQVRQLLELWEALATGNLDPVHLQRVLSSAVPFLPEVQDCLARLSDLLSSPDTSHSRFVWNDGILVDALERGSWLVLDNANLCNPSVLDRLNSLLEPDGFLAVSEQHNAGTDARVVRPHPGFRIFLTMDPQYGDLSRAMRNRSLEIAMPAVPLDQKSTPVIQYPCASAVARLRSLLQATMTGNIETTIESLIDNLSLKEMALALANLKHLPVDVADQTLAIELNKRQTLGSETFGDLVAPADLLASTGLPLLVTLNEPWFLLQRQLDVESLRHMTAEILTRGWYVSRRAEDIQARLREASAVALSVPFSAQTMLQKSTTAVDRRKALGTIPQVASFATHLISDLSRALKTTFRARLSVPLLEATERILVFSQDVIDNLDTKTLDFALLHAYMQLGSKLARSQAASLEGLASVFLQHLHMLSAHDSGLSTGLGLQLMWQPFQPKTAKSLPQLETQLRLEGLIARFDQLCRFLPQSRGSLSALRSKLQDTYVSIVESDQPETSLLALQEAVAQLEAQSQRGFLSEGKFQNELNFIYQMLKLQRRQNNSNNSNNSRDLAVLEMFIPESKRNLLTIGDNTSVAASLNQIGSLDKDVISGHEHVGLDLIRRLFEVREQPLGTLEHAKEELTVLIKTTTSHQLTLDRFILPLVAHIRTVVSGVLWAHYDFLTEEARACYAANEAFDLDRLAALPEHAVVVDEQDKAYFQAVFQHYLHPTLSVLSSQHPPTLDDVKTCLLNLSLAGLILMVPDKVFDPAILPTIEFQQHQRRLTELHSRIDGQRLFHSEVMGQKTSLVIRVLEQEAHDLGHAFSPPAVFRPSQSELPSLQQVFSRVADIVSPGQSHMSPLPGSDEWLKQWSSQQSRSNLAIIIDRLEHSHRVYDDFVKPIAWFLKTLLLGLELESTIAGPDCKPGVIQEVVSHTPMLGAEPTHLLIWNAPTVSRPALRFLWLEYIGMATHLVPEQGWAVSRGLLNLLDEFYGEWKARLTSAQAESEIRSRYYTYRGDAEQDEESASQELREMFPQFDDARSEDSQREEKYDARNVSIRLAAALQKIYPRQDFTDALQGYIVRALETISDLDVSESDNAGAALTDLLPGILLQMEAELTALSGSQSDIHFNIYTDYNIAESQKLFDLVRQVESRFQAILERWPEHAVPAEVLSFCAEVLHLSIRDPLAKLLAKTEKLYEIVSQWQSIASREWSVATLLGQLSAMIVNWRRMELLSWSRLLDEEQHRHEQDAQGWYFVAYEAIIYNATRMQVNDDVGQSYCTSLARTLEEFLKQTTAGQYSSRLRVLDALNRLLDDLSCHEKQLLPVRNCVANIIDHYRRYEANVAVSLQTGRADLEKALTEQIKLASWKDTNVTALRDSARRSHHKLFKIVRKYRGLLNQPLTVFKPSEDTSLQMRIDDAVGALSHSFHEEKAVTRAQHQCRQVITGWDARPERVTNPLGAIQTMRHLYTSTSLEIQPHLELASFREDLSEAIKELRAQTPSTLTEENTAFVRHLQERKRRLLADTMKAVSQMGIRRNLATSELEKQSSTAVILASSPEFSLENVSPVLYAANSAFHDLLDTMSQVRAARVDHSDDLTEGEINRGAGLLEGLLFMATNQRRNIALTTEGLRDLHEQILLLRTFHTCSSDMLSSSAGPAERQTLIKRLAWLLEVLKLADRILNFQAKHASLDITELVESIRSYSSRLKEMKTGLESIPPMPAGLQSHHAHDLQIQAAELLSQLGTLLMTWQVKEPLLESVLRQIIPWTEEISEFQDGSVNGVGNFNLQSFDYDLRILLDQIFVALQAFSSSQAGLPKTVEDAGWLSKSDNHIARTIRSLQAKTISQGLRSLLGKLHYFERDDLANVSNLLLVAAPIIEQYYYIQEHLHRYQTAVHLETCRVALQLARSFTILASQGLCRPSEPASGEEQSGKLESGMGLGEGEAAEDISKDVGDDEDLSELAQSGQKEEEEGEMEEADDAVDMGNDDLQGEMGDQGEQESGQDGDEERSDEEGDNDIDEETGSVDELDPSAVDEKMWDDMKDESKEDKEMKNDKAQGKKSDDQTAAEGHQSEGEDMEGQEGEELNDEEVEEGEGAERPEAENMDPYLENEKALDLPDELQLNGEDETKDDDISDDGMDELSDIDNPAEEVVEGDVEEESEMQEKPMDDTVESEEPGADEDELEDGVAQDDEIMEDQPEEREDEEQADHDTREDDTAHDMDETAGGESGAANQVQDSVDPEQMTQGMNQTEKEPDPQQSQPGKALENEEQGETGTGAIELGTGRADTLEHQQNEALRKLADVLDQYHQRREILPASNEQRQEDKDQDVDVNMTDVDFEHVQDEAEGDTQALGAAGADQAQNLDQSRAIEDDEAPINEDTDLPDVPEPEIPENIADRFHRLQAQSKAQEASMSSGFIPDQESRRNDQNSAAPEADEASDDLAPEIEHLDLEQHEAAQASPPTSTSDAAALWNHCSAVTHQFSLVLTEQLRLILSPTTATKLRGDYRTGKRLNIKRIIPYIASNYKRDKIWMRRAVPSKRSYQIMIAVDDSKSMSESGADVLAFETLAMLTKSLSMLEVGELCVVGFGDQEHITVAHPFGTPFSPAESGPNVFRAFSFNQRGTNVRNLLRQSIQLFQDARRKGHSAAEDLWQLQLVVSDGHCSDHEAIARLVRQAQAEKIVIVFVIVDAGPESILDLKEAVFEPDPQSTVEGGPVEMRVRTKRYLEDFPFPYYLVVRDVRDLPGVLATALKGWFGSVVDVQ
ncbi:hypothetical protein A1O1_00504 [Capronia coronata CBS 617.96]|uniref:Midasin n=1 Tax=Capronia coronata CBS 617.96 TaxID=1182541 RepID=W9YS91_9EURO|nr:uncharacterized protein A1O1_00504 [Capronia coronata CBS 617.96]EXJ95383.1 hypothetical protein A1O1_00504 [Capronia coronata CBS 617.96]